jgi:hypothetical protein
MSDDTTSVVPQPHSTRAVWTVAEVARPHMQQMHQAVSFARCVRCGTACGLMRASEARAGRWLPALDRACQCGAELSELEPSSDDETRQLLCCGIPAVVLVPDGWPGR